MKTEISMLALRDNQVGRDFIVGDLHGCYDLLMEKLTAVSFDKSVDRLFCVGDLIDRGPYSEKCIELLYEPWFFATYGNHELMFLTYMGQYESGYHQAQDFLNNGGGWVNNVASSMLNEYTRLIKDKMYGIIEVGGSKDGFFVTHSELDTSHTHLDFFTWNRNILGEVRCGPVIAEKDGIIYSDTFDLNFKITYVGHNTLRKTLFINSEKVKNHLMLDTGAFRKNESNTYDLSLVEHSKFLTIVKGT